MIEETIEILDNMKVFGLIDDAFNRDFMEIEEAAKKQLAGGSLTEEEVEYYQPRILKDIKRLVEQLEEIKRLKTRMPEQMKEKADMLVWCIKDADKM